MPQVAYAIVWLKPSWHCGPFSGYDLMYKVFTEKLLSILPRRFHGPLDYISSPGIVIPTLVLLTLVIYYLISRTNSLREANADLKDQLHHERTEERRKLVQQSKNPTSVGGSGDPASISVRWKNILEGAAARPADVSFESKIEYHKMTTRVVFSKTLAARVSKLEKNSR